MSDDNAANTRKLLGEGRTSSIDVGSSNKEINVSLDPLAVLHTGTGEIFFIPAQDRAVFRTHHTSLSDAVAEYHSANQAVQLLDQHRKELLCHKSRGDHHTPLQNNALGIA